MRDYEALVFFKSAVTVHVPGGGGGGARASNPFQLKETVTVTHGYMVSMRYCYS